MDVFIEKAKVKKVLRRKEYQEVFFKSRLLNGSKSLKIYDCKKDIASLLKKSFWGCRSVFEIHWLRLFPVKVCLDGVPLREFEGLSGRAENPPYAGRRKRQDVFGQTVGLFAELSEKRRF